MWFYEISAVSEKTLTQKGKTKDYNFTQEIKSKTVLINGKDDKAKTEIIISEIMDRKITALMVVKEKVGLDINVSIKTFFEDMKMPIVSFDSKEITISRTLQLAHNSSRRDFISDDDELFEKYKLNNVNCYEGSSRLAEKLCDTYKSKAEAFKIAKSLLCFPDIDEEMNRIFSTSKEFYAHPVQYVIMCDDNEKKENLRELLVSSLYLAKRLTSRRYCYVGPNTDRRNITVDLDVAKELYKAQRGTTIVLQPGSIPVLGGVVDSSYEIVQKLCELVGKYHRDTLSIIELKRNDEETFKLIRSELPDLRFIVLKEDLMPTDIAKQYLIAKAQANKVRCFQPLLEQLPSEEQNYYPTDLNRIFDKWFEHYVCDDVYPQYKKMNPGEKEKENTAKGTAYSRLIEMIGLSQAKKILQDAINYNKAQKYYKEYGLDIPTNSRHMVFSGNPGSAKTSVARLFAQILKDNGVLQKGTYIEAGRSDIVDMYLGGTAPRVKRLFERAEGGVLFIDEAYSLVDGHRGLYGDEAINTIVQEMENKRDSVIVIFAGYTDKMNEFLDNNPGLRSRIAFHVPFEDYDSDELMDILRLFAKNQNLILAEDVESKVIPIFDEARKHKEFGNGRFVRNMFEKAIMNQAGRVLSINRSSLNTTVVSTLTADDFEVPSEYAAKEYKTIGFAS